jgi:hypothetical protein
MNVGSHTFNSTSPWGLFWAIFNGTINIEGPTYTFTTTVAVSQATVMATGNGAVAINNVNPPNFVNAAYVNGPKYDCSVNGIIGANGLGVNFLPGSSPGFTATGGQASW